MTYQTMAREKKQGQGLCEIKNKNHLIILFPFLRCYFQVLIWLKFQSLLTLRFGFPTWYWNWKCYFVWQKQNNSELIILF